MRQEVKDSLEAVQLQYKDDISRAEQEIGKLASKNLAFRLEAQEQERIQRKIRRASVERREKPEIEEPRRKKKLPETSQLGKECFLFLHFSAE